MQRHKRAGLTEKERVLFVRVPENVHQALKAEAKSLGKSVNLLCVERLMSLVDGTAAGEMPHARQ